MDLNDDIRVDYSTIEELFASKTTKPKEAEKKKPTEVLFLLLCLSSVVCRHCLSASVTRRICRVTHQGVERGGPVVLRPVMATPCFNMTFAHCYKIKQNGREMKKIRNIQRVQCEVYCII